MHRRSNARIVPALVFLAGSAALAAVPAGELPFVPPLPSIEAAGAVPVIERDRVVIKLRADAAGRAAELPELDLPRGIAELDALLGRHGITEGRRVVLEHGKPIGDEALFRRIGLDRAYVLELPEAKEANEVWKLVRELSREPWVEYAEPVYLLTPTATPDDALFGEQWAHRNVGQTVNGVTGAPDADADTDLAWDTETGSGSAIVAVLDTGVDLDHPDLVANVIAGYDFIGDDPLADDASGHGTSSAGIAAARGNNAIGVAGVCWNCSIIPLRVSSSQHEADAMRFAADNGADTLNMSHTFGASWIQIIIDATEYAAGLGALSFASATNFNGYNIGTPAAYPEVVPVGGSNSNDVRVYSYSDVTDVTGPGPNTRSTALGGGYTYFGGTSSSSPFAAGLGALLRAQDPGLHVRELRHLIRLGCEDQVGGPAEDTPGWDQFMGYGRLNAANSMALIAGPWIAFSRPHYVCAGDLTIALKDTTAGSSVQVTVTGDIGGDVETLSVTPVPGANGYYEGTIPLAWAGKDGPVILGDGKLDVVHGENLDADSGALAATAFMQCTKKVCQLETYGLSRGGDCDADGVADPGEIWTVSPPIFSYQTEQMFDVKATVTTTDPNVIVLKASADYGTVNPFSVRHSASDDAIRIQMAPGTPLGQVVDFDVTISGRGWEADQTVCQVDEGLAAGFSIIANRDLGPVVQSWDFDDGTGMGFKVEPAHGVSGTSGDLSECSGSWINQWSTFPATDRAHSGSHSLRLGDGTDYLASNDSGLKTPFFAVPAGGGAISFYVWMDSYLQDPFRAWDGMVVEAKRSTDAIWSYRDDATYSTKQVQSVCGTGTRVPFGFAEHVDMIAGDGTDTDVTGDTFDVQHQANLSQFAGEQVHVRWRFGSHDFASATTHGSGVWIDTVAVHGPYVTDAWHGEAPVNLQGSDASCTAAFDLSWDPIAGAGGYEIHRSDVSCDDALASLTPYDTSVTSSYSDTAATEGIDYYYAVGGTAADGGCPTVRACVPGGCPACAAPPDPSGLLLDKDGGDVLLSWTGSAPSGPTWNVYRDPAPDRTLWGAPLASGVTDEDGGAPGTQFRDVGGLAAGTLQHYLVTEVTCAESPL